ncbi:MAG: GTPase [Phycisphaerales bacterium]
MNAFHAIDTPASSVGAVSILRVVSSELDAVFEAIQINPVGVGAIKLASVLGIDDAVIARFDESTILIMPHGGIGITRRISESLAQVGIPLADAEDPAELYPEAADIHEARMLWALSIAPSPLAVDLLLDQPRRWRARLSDEKLTHEDLADSEMLDRLLVPPVVVAVGRANIGKSSMINALTGTSVSIVSDQAGTTRDHVGVMLDLAGLVVRWVDTPGVDERVEVDAELANVSSLVACADLVVHAIDHADQAALLDPRLGSLMRSEIPVLRVGVRSDLGESLAAVDCVCSAKAGTGIVELAGAVRESLVSASAMADLRAWKYWE